MVDSSFLVVIGLGAVLVIGVILFIIISMRRPGKTLNKEQYQKDWEQLQQNIGDNNSSMQFAILQADKLLDKALKESGYKGKTMGERMTSASRIFSKPDAVWSAHKLRNRIAHESNVKVSEKLTHRALLCFKKALRDVGAL